MSERVLAKGAAVNTAVATVIVHGSGCGNDIDGNSGGGIDSDNDIENGYGIDNDIDSDSKNDIVSR